MPGTQDRGRNDIEDWMISLAFTLEYSEQELSKLEVERNRDMLRITL